MSEGGRVRVNVSGLPRDRVEQNPKDSQVSEDSRNVQRNSSAWLSLINPSVCEIKVTTGFLGSWLAAMLTVTTVMSCPPGRILSVVRALVALQDLRSPHWLKHQPNILCSPTEWVLWMWVAAPGNQLSPKELGHFRNKAFLDLLDENRPGWVSQCFLLFGHSTSVYGTQTNQHIHTCENSSYLGNCSISLL